MAFFGSSWKEDDNGSNESYQDGYSYGYDIGYDRGEAKGYDDGWNAAIDACARELLSSRDSDESQWKRLLKLKKK